MILGAIDYYGSPTSPSRFVLLVLFFLFLFNFFLQEIYDAGGMSREEYNSRKLQIIEKAMSGDTKAEPNQGMRKSSSNTVPAGMQSLSATTVSPRKPTTPQKTSTTPMQSPSSITGGVITHKKSEKTPVYVPPSDRKHSLPVEQSPSAYGYDRKTSVPVYSSAPSMQCARCGKTITKQVMEHEGKPYDSICYRLQVVTNTEVSMPSTGTQDSGTDSSFVNRQLNKGKIEFS